MFSKRILEHGTLFSFKMFIYKLFNIPFMYRHNKGYEKLKIYFGKNEILKVYNMRPSPIYCLEWYGSQYYQSLGIPYKVYELGSKIVIRMPKVKHPLFYNRKKTYNKICEHIKTIAEMTGLFDEIQTVVFKDYKRDNLFVYKNSIYILDWDDIIINNIQYSHEEVFTLLFKGVKTNAIHIYQ